MRRELLRLRRRGRGGGVEGGAEGREKCAVRAGHIFLLPVQDVHAAAGRIAQEHAIRPAPRRNDLGNAVRVDGFAQRLELSDQPAQPLRLRAQGRLLSAACPRASGPRPRRVAATAPLRRGRVRSPSRLCAASIRDANLVHSLGRRFGTWRGPTSITASVEFCIHPLARRSCFLRRGEGAGFAVLEAAEQAVAVVAHGDHSFAPVLNESCSFRSFAAMPVARPRRSDDDAQRELDPNGLTMCRANSSATVRALGAWVGVVMARPTGREPSPTGRSASTLPSTLGRPAT
jgi:hypothetical protein